MLFVLNSVEVGAKVQLHPGDSFNRWTVVREVESAGQSRYLCICTCGTERVLRSQDLRTGHSKSCGCWRVEQSAQLNRKHGMASHQKGRPPEYAIWSMMRQRCNNPNNKDFPNYGGRGIKVCQRWDSFANFIADVGSRPPGNMTIERVDNEGDYEPSNCIWLPKSQQSRNRRTPNTQN